MGKKGAADGPGAHTNQQAESLRETRTRYIPCSALDRVYGKRTWILSNEPQRTEGDGLKQASIATALAALRKGRYNTHVSICK